MKMTRRFTLFQFLLAISLLGLTIFSLKFGSQPDGQVIGGVVEEGRVCFGGHCFAVESAKTPAEQAKGLMYRDYLGKGKGMLFVYADDAVRTFWMKNTYISLDIIWLDSEKRVVNIAKNTQPCGSGVCPTINPGVPARYVLELNGGKAEETGLKKGDLFEF